MVKRISIQGYEGSFHQLAAQEFFGKQVQVIPCATFRELIQVAEDKKQSEGGIMAIENSIAGSIIPNYNLLAKSKLRITGEVYLHIKQQLMANPGVDLKDIREVHSHPMAILQCMDFLERYNWKLVETDDTALSAKHIHQHRSKHAAAIAGKLAADLYQLSIIAPNIHTMKTNYTRFLVVQPEELAATVVNADKASLSFHTDHSQGSLAKVLTCIANNGINLSKLQSMPIAGTNFKYSFYVDMEFNDLNQLHTVLDAIKPVTESLRIFGVYKRGK